MNAYASPYTDNGVDIMTRRVASAFGSDVEIEIVDSFDVRLRPEFRKHLKVIPTSPIKLLCVHCGERSDNLCAIYFGDKTGMANFLQENPNLAASLVTVGAGWGIVWLRISGFRPENTDFVNGLWVSSGPAPVAILLDPTTAPNFATYGKILSKKFADVEWPMPLKDSFIARDIETELGPAVTQDKRKNGRLNLTTFAQIAGRKADLFYDVDANVFIRRNPDQTCTWISVEILRQSVVEDLGLFYRENPNLSTAEIGSDRIEALVDEIKNVTAFNRRIGLLNPFAARYRRPLDLESLPVL
jgi:hypothetical protein